MSLRRALTSLLALLAIACGSPTPPALVADWTPTVVIAPSEAPASPPVGPEAPAAAPIAPVVRPALPAPSVPPVPPLLPPAPTTTTCHWVAPTGGVLTLQGGTNLFQFSLPAGICVDFTGRVEWDRPFADQYAHQLRTVSGSFRVDRYTVAAGVTSWILPDFGYVRG